MDNKVLKFYLWKPFPDIEGAFIAEQVSCKGGIMWDSQHGANIIFAYVARGPAVIEEVRRSNGRAVLVALIKRGGSGDLKQRCLAAGASVGFYMPTHARGFKQMFTRLNALYAQL